MLLAIALFFAGSALIVDGGFVRAAKRQAVAEAGGAAVEGAQALDTRGYRQGGPPRLDVTRAHALVASYMAATGHDFEVAVRGDRVTVSVFISERTPTLAAVGIGSIRVRGTVTARLQVGVRQASS